MQARRLRRRWFPSGAISPADRFCLGPALNLREVEELLGAWEKCELRDTFLDDQVRPRIAKEIKAMPLPRPFRRVHAGRERPGSPLLRAALELGRR